MSTPYIGEIRMFAGNFPPVGWEFCNGQLVPISENDALFTVIGTTYGGDGQETFALPNLQSRIPMHMGTGVDGITYQIGEMAGTEMETLTTQQIPSHRHGLAGSANAASPAYTGATGFLGKVAGGNAYALAAGGSLPMKANSASPAGGSQPHENLAPFLCINFIISMFGVFPSQT
jgi:microcystin-dependent protein